MASQQKAYGSHYIEEVSATIQTLRASGEKNRAQTWASDSTGNLSNYCFVYNPQLPVEFEGTWGSVFVLTNKAVPLGGQKEQL